MLYRVRDMCIFSLYYRKALCIQIRQYSPLFVKSKKTEDMDNYSIKFTDVLTAFKEPWFQFANSCLKSVWQGLHDYPGNKQGWNILGSGTESNQIAMHKRPTIIVKPACWLTQSVHIQKKKREESPLCVFGSCIRIHGRRELGWFTHMWVPTYMPSCSHFLTFSSVAWDTKYVYISEFIEYVPI